MELGMYNCATSCSDVDLQAAWRYEVAIGGENEDVSNWWTCILYKNINMVKLLTNRRRWKVWRGNTCKGLKRNECAHGTKTMWNKVQHSRVHIMRMTCD